jgi:hypothetical protein
LGNPVRLSVDAWRWVVLNARTCRYEILLEFRASSAAQFALRQAHCPPDPDSYRAGIAVSDPVQLRFIAERLVGLPPQRWSLALGSNDLAAPEGALSLEQLLLEMLVGNEPELRALRASRSFATTDAYCTELRRRSQRELTAFYGASGVERFKGSRVAPRSRR